MSIRPEQTSKSALELIEEATHLLRSLPATTLATYYAGAIPFVLGLLFFWTDMSRSPFAYGHLAEGALGTAVLFVWMKVWQVAFAERVRAHISARPPQPWTIRDAVRVFTVQAIIQSSGLFLIPLSLVVMIPSAWVYAFYQNATTLDDSRSGDVLKVVRKSIRQAQLWPLQNHYLLGSTCLFGFCVFLNWFVVGFSIPHLMKMLFGIETVFTLDAASMLNTTFIASVFAITYLSVDPILKTVYSLRCFYGDSMHSGEDLKATLKQFTTPGSHWVGVAFTAIVISATSLAAQGTEPAVSGTVLDKQIEEVIHAPKYAWRLPRVIQEQESQKGIVSRFLDDVGDMIRRGLRASFSWIDKLLRRWLDSNRDARLGRTPFDWMSSSLLLYGLLAVVLALLIVFIRRVWAQRSPTRLDVRAEAIQYAPDVADENIGADQLPGEGWIQLAHELIGRGEFRLAVRALYLSSLAHLAQQNLIVLAKFKSNREYEIELRRRAHAIPDLHPIFAENISTFERIWYGTHEVNDQVVHNFAANAKRIATLQPQQS